jgi:hypothetical protein
MAAIGANTERPAISMPVPQSINLPLIPISFVGLSDDLPVRQVM